MKEKIIKFLKKALRGREDFFYGAKTEEAEVFAKIFLGGKKGVVKEGDLSFCNEGSDKGSDEIGGFVVISVFDSKTKKNFHFDSKFAQKTFWKIPTYATSFDEEEIQYEIENIHQVWPKEKTIIVWEVA